MAKLARAIGMAALALVVGCAGENPLSLRLFGNLLVTRTDKTSNLCYPIQAQVYRSEGVLDLMSLAATYGQYYYYARVDNLLQNTDIINGNKEAQVRSTKANVVTLRSVHAALVDDDNGTMVPKEYKSTKMPITSASIVTGTDSPIATETGWQASTSQVLDPQGTALFPAALIPPKVFNEWYKVWAALSADARAKRVDKLTVRLAVQGTQADGTVVSSGSVDYPLQVCWGCLQIVPVDASNASAADNAKACVATKVPSDFIVPCVPGQDDFQPCQQYCQFCKTRELNGAAPNTQGACDTRFCPALTEDDLKKFGLSSGG